MSGSPQEQCIANCSNPGDPQKCCEQCFPKKKQGCVVKGGWAKGGGIDCQVNCSSSSSSTTTSVNVGGIIGACVFLVALVGRSDIASSPR